MKNRRDRLLKNGFVMSERMEELSVLKIIS
jgi:hypothetical protein